MENFVSLYFYTLFYLLIVLLLYFSSGFFVLYIFNKKILESFSVFVIFLSLFIGEVLLTTFYAIYRTQGKSILLLTLPFLIVFFYKLRTINFYDFKSLKNKDLKKIVLLGIIFIPSILLIFHVRYYNHEMKNYLLTHNDDWVFYSKVSDYIDSFGIENISINYIDMQNTNMVYHFFDLWQNAFVADLYSINYLNSLLTISYISNYIILFWGVLCIFEYCFKFFNSLKINFFYFLIFLGAIFASNFYHEKIKLFFKQIDLFGVNFAEIPKILPIYIIFILISLFFLNRYYLISYSLAIISIIYNPALAPSILTTLFLFLMLDFILLKKFQNNIYLILLLIVFSIAFLLFYKFTGKNTSSSLLFSNPLILETNPLVFAKIFFGSIFLILILYFPYFYLFLKVNNTILNNLKFILFIVTILSLLSWTFLNNLHNSSQLFYISFTPFAQVVIYYLIFFGLADTRKKIRFYSISLILISSVFFLFRMGIFKRNTINKNVDYIIEVQNKIKNLNFLGAYIYSKEKYIKRKSDFFVKVYNVYTPGIYLANFNTKYHPECLSVHDIEYDEKSKFYHAEKQIIENAPFYQFVENQKQNNQFISIEQSQIDFIKKYNIQWLITDKKAVLSEQLKNLIVDKIEKEGFNEVFYVLDTNKLE